MSIMSRKLSNNVISNSIDSYVEQNYKEGYIESVADVKYGLERGDKELILSIWEYVIQEIEAEKEDIAALFIEGWNVKGIKVNELIK